MKSKKLILLTLSSAAVLAFGQFAGAQTPDCAPAWHHHGPTDMTKMLSHALNLTDAQKAQVQTMVAAVQPQLEAIHQQAHAQAAPIIKQLQPQLEAIHQQARAQAAPIIKQLHTQIRPLLTADQQKKLDALETLHDSGSE